MFNHFSIEKVNCANKTKQAIWNAELHSSIESTSNSSELWKNVNKMGLEVMDML